MPPLSPKAKALLKARQKPLVRPEKTAGKSDFCSKCGSALQKCPKCGMLTLRNNTFNKEWENACHMRKCHGTRFICAKCKQGVC